MNILCPNIIIMRASLISLLCLGASLVHAALIPISESSFSTAQVIDFSTLADGTDANGLLTGGVLFTVLQSGTPTDGLVIVDGGPGTTNHIVPPNLVSLRKPGELALTLFLPSPVSQLGYGYALLATTPLSPATTIQLFAGTTPLGSIQFAGQLDPEFTGGFAGVRSTIPFDRAVLTFSDAADAFAVDNIMFANAAVSDAGSTLLLLAIGTAGTLAALPIRRSCRR